MLKEKETENKEYLIPKSLAEVISYNTFCPCKNENSFLIFNSINEIHILIFFEIGKIVSYNLEEKKIIYEKKVERKEIINLFNHVCCDKKDLILVSFLNNNKVKIMDFINNEYISEISTLQNSIIKNIITFFHSNELTIIIHCNIGMLVQDQVDSYNYKSKVLKKIPLNLNTLIIFMKYYYDDNLDMNCILIGNKTEISIFNYEDITKIKNYYDYSNQLINGYHNYNSAFIIEYNNNKRIFSGCGDGAINGIINPSIY